MLVLTRRTGESIVIGDQIVVTVLEVRSDQVRIGIQAPRSVQIHREEVVRRVEGENVAAAASAARARALLDKRPPAPGGRRPVPPPRPPRDRSEDAPEPGQPGAD
jgi:carbon storage regulator